MLILVYVVYILWIIYFPKLKRTVFKPCFVCRLPPFSSSRSTRMKMRVVSTSTTSPMPTTFLPLPELLPLPSRPRWARRSTRSLSSLRTSLTVLLLLRSLVRSSPPPLFVDLIDTIKNVIVKCFTVPVGFLTTYLVPNPTKSMDCLSAAIRRERWVLLHCSSYHSHLLLVDRLLLLRPCHYYWEMVSDHWGSCIYSFSSSHGSRTLISLVSALSSVSLSFPGVLLSLIPSSPWLSPERVSVLWLFPTVLVPRLSTYALVSELSIP